MSSAPLKQWWIIVCSLMLFVCRTGNLYAQDPHFSQFYSSPLLLNPAYTGIFAGDVRIISNYRNQWRSVSTPFTTATVAVDAQAFKSYINEDDIFGVGLVGVTDHSNNRGLNSSYATLSAAYTKSLDPERLHKLGLGFQMTYVTKRVDYSKFVFSTQFTPGGFDRTLPTGEPISGFTMHYLDYATGILYSGMNDYDQNWYIGGSYYHFTKPNESISGEAHPLEPRYSVHGGFNFPTDDRIRIYFSALYTKSALMNELMGGVVLESNFNTYEYEGGIYGGLYYRKGDAIIPHMGLNKGNFQLGLSYDINVSSLSKGTQGRGGLELSLLVMFAKDPDAAKIPRCYGRF